jgi:hypothetical protein
VSESSPIYLTEDRIRAVVREAESFIDEVEERLHAASRTQVDWWREFRIGSAKKT